MSRLYLITSVLAISFFSYAQYRGMAFYTGAGAQQLRSGGSGSGYSRSSSLSHK
ncbi:MAG TPA: hypothetical protein VGN52_08940 [Burkholderiales bacterium]|jgi:hypothetical protein